MHVTRHDIHRADTLHAAFPWEEFEYPVTEFVNETKISHRTHNSSTS